MIAARKETYFLRGQTVRRRTIEEEGQSLDDSGVEVGNCVIEL